jgi:hypothetical protein
MENLLLRQIKAQQLKTWRTGLINQLYPTKPIGTADEQQTLIISDLLGSFKRFSGNQQTAYDNGSVQRSATSTVNQLERQVERAMAEVLGQSPGQNGVVLRNLFKTKLSRDNGDMLTASSSQLMSYTVNGKSELLSELSTRQAALYRQTSIIMADALRIVERLSSFVTQSDQERVEALRSLITSSIKALIEEFRWIDEPRPSRVEYYLGSITDSVMEFGRQAFLTNTRLAVTVDDENQVTQFELLKTYVQMLRQAWEGYKASGTSSQASPLSERIDRARVLLPVLVQGTLDFSNALESVGLSDSERRSRASRFSTLDRLSIEIGSPIGISREPLVTDIGNSLPDITVSDLIDWLDRFANQEALALLDNTYGIDFVTDQADELFWTIAPIVAHLKTTAPVNAASRSMLEQILSNERVTWALDNLLIQLHELASLSA